MLTHKLVHPITIKPLVASKGRRVNHVFIAVVFLLLFASWSIPRSDYSATNLLLLRCSGGLGGESVEDHFQVVDFLLVLVLQ